MFSCVSVAAGWIRKEDYSSGNDFFNLDVSNTFVSPKVIQLLGQSMSEFHVDKLVPNLKGMHVNIRVGSRDVTTHPWFSRRMLRILKYYGISVDYEELEGKEHWWWDTRYTNDGGVLNDDAMRTFYDGCFDDSSENNDLSYVTSGLCILSVINPGIHSGKCGVKIIQQVNYMELTSLIIESISGINDSKTNCENTRRVTSGGNVRRMNFLFGKNGLKHFDCFTIIVDDVSIQVPTDHFIDESIDICFSDDNQFPFICNNEINPLHDRIIETTGSLRHVYSKPFVIVYGTLNGAASKLLEFAVYIANLHYAAHYTSVEVLSDDDFLIHGCADGRYDCNVVFIGGGFWNSAIQTCCTTKTTEDFGCNCPFQFAEVENRNDGLLTPQFVINDMLFDDPNDGVLFTFPLVDVKVPINSASFCVCIHSNSLGGFQHLSRLAWPVVPPMVRSPYSNYIPDYIVIDDNIWSKGFGSVKMMGFWNATWGVNEYQGYIRHGNRK